MKIKELLTVIGNVTARNNLPTAYVCGGAARDFYMNNLENISDLDITNGESSIKELSFKVFQELNKTYNVIYKSHENNNTSIYIGSFKLDFSSNFIIPRIDDKLKVRGIIDPSNLQREMFSRDFYCNSLLLSLDFKQLIDITGKGKHDLDTRIINTCLDPYLTFDSSHNRVVRALYLAAKLGCTLHPNIIRCLEQRPELMANASMKSLTEKLQMALSYDKEKTIGYLDQLNLWKYVPPIATLAEEQKKRLIVT